MAKAKRRFVSGIYKLFVTQENDTSENLNLFYVEQLFINDYLLLALLNDYKKYTNFFIK